MQNNDCSLYAAQRSSCNFSLAFVVGHKNSCWIALCLGPAYHALALRLLLFDFLPIMIA